MKNKFITRKIKHFSPDNSWEVVFEDGVIRPVVGWAIFENYINGEYRPDHDEVVAMIHVNDGDVELMDLATYENYLCRSAKSPEILKTLHGSIVRHQRRAT